VRGELVVSYDVVVERHGWCTLALVIFVVQKEVGGKRDGIGGILVQLKFVSG
jgi:hypothetical protein